MPYVALVDLEIGASFKEGDIISEDFLRKEQRSGTVLVNQNLARYVREAPVAAKAAPRKEPGTIPPVIKTEETAPVAEEASKEPVKATVVKAGVWYKVFAGSLQIGKPTRDEKQANKMAKEFNAKL